MGLGDLDNQYKKEKQGGGGGGDGATIYQTSYGWSQGSPQQISSYPESGLKPQGDGTYGYPTDMQIEQAANIPAIIGKEANNVMDKFYNGLDMYRESDRSIDAITDALEAQATRKMSNTWQAQNQRENAVLNYIAGQSGTGWGNSSYKQNVKQALGTVDDMADVQAIQAYDDAINQAYIDNATQHQQNRNAINESAIDTEAALGSLGASLAAQFASIHPGIPSGVYGTNKYDADDSENGFFTYLSKEDRGSGIEGNEELSALSQLAKENQNESNYDIEPVIDRTNRTVNNPSWFPQFKASDYMLDAITPKRTSLIRGANEKAVVNQSQKATSLQPYISGYSNRK